MNKLKRQTKRPIKNKNERGITLVALIITIIILIILAAVTINALTHDGLAEMAIKGAQDYDKAQQNEMNMLNDIDAMVKETLKNIEDGTTKPKPEEPTPPQTIEDPEEIANNIGNAVDYMPKANQSYRIEPRHSGPSSSQSFSTNDLTGTWNIWSVDSENIFLISNNVTSKNLTLRGSLGYNNGVTLLDNICDTCFTDKTSYPNMTGRNLKLEDVLNVLTDTSTRDNDYGKAPYLYSLSCPYVWRQYEMTQIDSMANRSTAYPLTTNGTFTGQSYQPYHTAWSKNGLERISEWTNSAYLEMVISPASVEKYWLSTRGVAGTQEWCNFSLRYVYNEGVSGATLLYAKEEGESQEETAYAVRPLVQIPLTSCKITQNEDGTLHIAPKG